MTGRCRPDPVMPFSPFSDAFLRGSQSFDDIKTEQPVVEEIGPLLPPCLPRLFSLRLQSAPAHDFHVLEQVCVTRQRLVAQSCYTPTAQIWALAKRISRENVSAAALPTAKSTSQPVPGSVLYQAASGNTAGWRLQSAQSVPTTSQVPRGLHGECICLHCGCNQLRLPRMRAHTRGNKLQGHQ